LIKIVVIDRQERWHYFRSCLSSQRDFELAGFGKDGYDALKLLKKFRPDIVLMEVNIHIGDGVKTSSLIKYRSPGTSIIVTTENAEEIRFAPFLYNAISGFITNDADPELLCQAIRTVNSGAYFMIPEIAHKFNKIAERVLTSIEDLPDFSALMPPGETNEKSSVILPETISPSERQIMSFVGQGLTNKEIAAKLMLREGTLRNYISAVLQKTGLKDRTQMAIYALKAGL
jgi:DNA-binding NarL/FixJ family response regulator